MAETLCGSPLYMAPEILRYEKYDAKADLWSVGAVLYEMSVGRSPFRAPNHVELLRRIEKGGDRIKFPDESSRAPTPGEGDAAPPIPVSPDIKALIRGLLKQRPAERMGFDEFFANGSAVWEGYMTESTGDVTTSIDVSTDSSALAPSAGDLHHRSGSSESFGTAPLASPSPTSPVHAAVKRAMSGEFSRPTASPTPVPTPVRPPSGHRSEPKYYVGDEPAESLPPSPTSPTGPTTRGGPGPQPIGNSAVVRSRAASRTAEVGPNSASVEDPPLVTPTVPPLVSRPSIGGSPLAATPPITMTGNDENTLANSDSVGREYVVVEKRTVEINELADELEQAARRPSVGAVARKPSSRAVVARQMSQLKPANSSPPGSSAQLGYSPPFPLGTTPPFAVPPVKPTGAQRPRQPSLPHTPTVFPPPGAYAMSSDRRPSLPSSHALARVLTNTAVRLLNTSASTAATALARATGANYKRWPQVERSGELDPDEGELLDFLEDTAHKAFALFDLADTRLVQWSQLSRMPPQQVQSPSATITQRNSPPSPSNTPPFAVPPVSRRKSSASSMSGDVLALRQQVEAAGDACALYFKSLAFICAGHERFKRYWELRERRSSNYQTSAELNERECEEGSG